MKRYLDIVRQIKSDRNTPPPVGSLANREVRKNEINEKRSLALGQRVRWSREVTGRVVLACRNGWIAVQCEPVDLVFLRVDERVQVVKE